MYGEKQEDRQKAKSMRFTFYFLNRELKHLPIVFNILFNLLYDQQKSRSSAFRRKNREIVNLLTTNREN